MEDIKDIEGISQEEFNYLLNNPEELKQFIQIPGYKQLLTEEQLVQALNITGGPISE